tara:strand:- start:300 stop:521 length:222 start_codon:yes stop_codon:yes gene_type:complete
MSRTFNEQYFDKLNEIESSGEDYNRNYAVEELIKLNMTKEEAEEFCDGLESKWDMQVDYLAEVQREEGGKETE